tara:strand:+ start:1134 stop:1319 length:186 start_codon:yes stop_codon:yes gene_type:complete
LPWNDEPRPRPHLDDLDFDPAILNALGCLAAFFSDTPRAATPPELKDKTRYFPNHQREPGA